jgi:hypothetical protein
MISVVCQVAALGGRGGHLRRAADAVQVWGGIFAFPYCTKDRGRWCRPEKRGNH